MKHSVFLAAATCLAWGLACAAAPAVGTRQAEVASRGAEVMPFSLEATRHVFTKTADGGIQRVVARKSGDARQVALVQQHLRQIEAQFRRRDFSAPAQIHGAAMPGLAQLQSAPAGELKIAYRDLPDGAELRFSSARPELVDAVHRWFDAQLSDHGADAMAGHPHHGAGPHRN